MARQRKKILICGATNTGKSTDLKKIIDPITERTIIFDPNRQAAHNSVTEITLEKMAVQKSGRYKICLPAEDFKKFFRILLDSWKKNRELGGCVVLEDASSYLPMQKDDEIYQMLVSARHCGFDIIITTHEWQYTPQWVIREMTDLLFKKTGDNWKQIIDRFPSRVVDKCKEKFDLANNDPSPYSTQPLTISQTGSINFQ